MARNTVKIRILDEVYMAIVGLRENDLNWLYDKYGMFTASYFFHPKFKCGQWDGKIRFFQKTGKTYLYLIDDILPQLDAWGYDLVLEDLRTSNPKTPSPINKNVFAAYSHEVNGEMVPIILRDYQVEAVNALLMHGYGMVIAATGAGKTLITAALVHAWELVGSKTITIVPDEGLILQTKAKFIQCGLDTGEYSGADKDINHAHVVSTWQAIQHNPKIVQQFDVILVDEAHGAKATVLQEILTNYAGLIQNRFGVTGTLPKPPNERMVVLSALGPPRYEISADQLINEGVLANLHIDVIQLEENLEDQYKEFCKEDGIGQPPTYIQFKDAYFPDFASEKSYLHRNSDRIEWIAHLIEISRDKAKGNVLCLVDSIPFGRRLAECIPGAIFVNGQDVKKAKNRKLVYDKFKTQDNLVVIATVHIAGTGLDIPRIFSLFFVDIGKSFIRVIQSIGRGLRKAHDKDSVLVVDISSDLKYGKRHTASRIKYYKEAKYPYKKRKIKYGRFDD